jgi:hypothetical protein
MNKPTDYITEMFHKLREDISGIKHKLFTEKAKLESIEAKPSYTIDTIHKDEQPNYEDDKAIRAVLKLPESIHIDAKTEERQKRWYKDRAVFFQVLTIAVGTVVAVIYGLQLRAMLDSNRINRDALVAVQRAFIVFHSIEEVRARVSTSINKVDFKWQFTPLIENTGATPATIAIEEFSLQPLPGGEPTEDQFAQGAHHSVFNIGPRIQQSGPTADIDDTLILGTINGALGPNASNALVRNIFGWGFIAYKDVFADTKIHTPIHVTEFCSQLQRVIYISPPGQKVDEKTMPNASTSFNLVWRACQEHNCIDQYCKDYDKVAKLLPD